MPTADVTTGVDQLLQLINERGQITVKDAAKRLSVSPQTVEDWAALLEDSGVITIQYRLANTYLARKAASAAEKEKIETAVALGERTFLKGGQGLISYLDRLEEQIRQLDLVVKRLDIGRLAGATIKEVKGLEEGKRKSEAELVGLSKEVQAELQGILNSIHGQKQQLKELYAGVFASLAELGHVIAMEHTQFAMLDQNERILEKKLAKTGTLFDGKLVALALRKHTLQSSAVKRLRRLAEQYEALRTELVAGRKRTAELLTLHKKRTHNLWKSRALIAKQLKASYVSLGEKLPAEAGRLVKQREHISNIVGELFDEEKSLKSRISQLLMKGKITEKQNFSRVQKEIDHLNTELTGLVGRRGKLEKQLKELSETLKG